MEKIEVIAGREGRKLTIWYLVHGDIGDISLPEAGSPGPADELWKHTCFEAFVRVGEGGSYFEFNFAPSNQWAAYSFQDYRSGMETVDLSWPVRIHERGDTSYGLRASVGFDQPASVRDWQVGLSAVIEETNGRLSYWALAHPPGKPDFHHRDCFAAQLDAPSRA